jgi:hypothetical protein
MGETIICRLCGIRRAKRACPAVHGEICAICCGEQREVTLSCPLDCEFLRAAHKHEKTVDVPAEAISDPDVEVTEDFIRLHEELLLFLVYTVLQAALRTQGAVDTDVLGALGALIQTRRTAQSGLLYETRAGNNVAASVQQKISASMKDYEKALQDKEELSRSWDQDVFRILVFLHRIGQQNLNGRSKGRMFINLLSDMTPDSGVDERAPSIIL